MSTDCTCQRCHTADFTVEGKALPMAFQCDLCQTVMCVNCVGRVAELPGLEVFCCYACGARRLRDALSGGQPRNPS